MLSLFDTPSLERALSLPLDPKLHELLYERIDHINQLDFDVREITYFLVVEAGCPIEAVASELGWSPLVNPGDGRRFGEEGFHPFHDFLADRDGWLELHFTAGNDALVVVMVEDDGSAASDLLALCRTYLD